MCSYLLIISEYEWDDSILRCANEKIISRGPDYTNFKSIKIDGLFVYCFHNLLDISGSSILQPLDNEQKIFFFNGEIYSPKKNDIPDTKLLFEKINEGNFLNFLRKASGEFAITYIDKIKKEINIFTDLIGTKPIYFASNSRALAIASYSSSLAELKFNDIDQVKPNSHLQINFNDLANIKILKEKLYFLSLEQTINNFDSWNNSFLRSIKQRVIHFDTKIFVPLSSGYDSGAICAGLNKLNIPYYTVTIGDSENKEIMKKRIRMNKLASCQKHFQIPSITKQESIKISNLIFQKLGAIFYDHVDAPNLYPIMLHQDGGAVALFKICQFMRELGFNSMLSGSGADELYSDYGFAGKKIYAHSEFGGLFPIKLDKIFPWKKFYFDSQRSYLKKDEMISGLFGIEGRYPFMDSELTQEFISTTADLKNSKYKNCIANFLDIQNYPYEENIKIGFGALKMSKIIYLKKIMKKLLRFN